MTNKERDKIEILRGALKNIRREIDKTRKSGGSLVGSVIGMGHIDQIAADALFNSAKYPKTDYLSEN